MRKINDLKNQRFGRLVVLTFRGTCRQGALWSCKCDCGARKTIKAVNLKTGKTKSCGCLKKDSDKKLSETMKQWHADSKVDVYPGTHK